MTKTVKDFLKAKEETERHLYEEIALPEVPTIRNRGVCIHHTFVPKYVKLDDNYAVQMNNRAIFIDEDIKGVGYDFIVAIPVQYTTERRVWTTMRWINQLDGNHALNRKRAKWGFGPRKGQYIKPNKDLVSICLIGDFSERHPGAHVYSIINEVIEGSGASRVVFFHSDFEWTTCPGGRWERGEMCKSSLVRLKDPQNLDCEIPK